MSSCAARIAGYSCRARKRASPRTPSTAVRSTRGLDPRAGPAPDDPGAAALSGALPRAAGAHAGVVLDLAFVLQPLSRGAGDALPYAVGRLWRRARPRFALARALSLYLRGVPRSGGGLSPRGGG